MEAQESFELFMLGGSVERGWRKLRPEIERLPWDTLDPKRHSPAAVQKGRRVWTMAAFQEHRTGAACAATLEALIRTRAPIDLVAMAARFPVDEMAHVEMCARIAQTLGGPMRLVYDVERVIFQPSSKLPARLRCAELVVRNFCVGEAVSIPILRASAKAASHPLLRAALSRIAKDEAAHGRFGFLYLDWVDEQLSDDDRAHLSAAARDEIKKVERNWVAAVGQPADEEDESETLGWMDRARYLKVARRAMDECVHDPLEARGISTRA